MRSSHAVFIIAIVWSVLLHAIALGLTGRMGWGYRVPPAPAPVEQAERIVKLMVEDKPPPPEEPFGEKEAKGLAINELDAPEPQSTPMVAENEQAMLSRDPAGESGEPRPPEPAPEPQTEQEQAQPMTIDRPPAPQVVASAPRPTETPKVDQSEQTVAPTETKVPDAAESTEAIAAAPQAPQIAQVVEQAARPTPPSEPSKALGDPAPESDRDSDAFGPAAAVELRAGKVSARAGRQFKFARPQHNLAGYVDAATIEFPATIHLSIELDQSGSPRRVIVTRSSGSSSIDRAVELAAYESWFEPLKAKTNKTGREQFDFGVVLH